MTSKRIRAHLLVAVLALVACLALAPVTARAAQTRSWSATTIAAFGGGFDMGSGPGGDMAAPGGDMQGFGGDMAAPGGEGMPAAPGAEGEATATEGEAAAEEETDMGDPIEELKNTLRGYRDYAEIHPVRVYGSMAALVIGLIFAFAYRKRA